MHDDFRIRVEVSGEQAHELLRALEAHERDGAGGLPSPEHVAVSHEDRHVFLYADSSEEAALARTAVEAILAEKGIAAHVDSSRWHPEEERWEDASLAMPNTSAEHAAEHERLEELETEESGHAGHAGWEVRVTLPTHHDAHAFAERLAAEGIPVQRHWRHLTLGAEDEDDARALAERLRSEAPQGSSLDVEGTAWDAWVAVNAPAGPFSFFGGLAQ
ncbi:MAG TPA: hypothetical protein VNU28_00340 [Solirubrobacteraceae bacterium]|nr:hypothetical protein [Solirubrobacteraceae bacterium]